MDAVLASILDIELQVLHARNSILQNAQSKTAGARLPYGNALVQGVNE